MYAHPYSTEMYDDTRYRAASRRICRDKYLDIICQFYVFVAFAAVAATAAAMFTPHNFKFCDCINDSKFHVPTNVWTDANKNRANDNESVKIIIQFGTVSIVWSTYCMFAFSLALSFTCSVVCLVRHLSCKHWITSVDTLSHFYVSDMVIMLWPCIFSGQCQQKKEKTDVMFDSSLFNLNETKKFFPSKSLRFHFVWVSPWELCPIGSLTASIQSTFCFSFYIWLLFRSTGWLTESFIRATFYFLHCHRRCHRHSRTSTPKRPII